MLKFTTSVRKIKIDNLLMDSNSQDNQSMIIVEQCYIIKLKNLIR